MICCLRVPAAALQSPCCSSLREGQTVLMLLQKPCTTICWSHFTEFEDAWYIMLKLVASSSPSLVCFDGLPLVPIERTQLTASSRTARVRQGRLEALSTVILETGRSSISGGIASKAVANAALTRACPGGQVLRHATCVRQVSCNSRRDRCYQRCYNEEGCSYQS